MARKKRCKVFVSYSRHDEVLVKPLAGLLGAAADDAVFLDVNSIKPGDLWKGEIDSALRDASVFILCWCCESQRSSFVRQEIEKALEGGGRRLVPVLFCSTPLPASLADRQWVDLRGRVVHSCCEHKPPEQDAPTALAPSGGMERVPLRQSRLSIWTTLSSFALLAIALGLAGLFSHKGPHNTPQVAATSHICKFSTGPRAGELWNFAPEPAQPVGSTCQDRSGNSGIVIAFPEVIERGPRSSPLWGASSLIGLLLLILGWFGGGIVIILVCTSLIAAMKFVGKQYRLQKTNKIASIATAYFEGLGKS